ncbi:hypothetical protein CHUAL_013777 [Chamberlinius hualienensis]
MLFSRFVTLEAVTLMLMVLAEASAQQTRTFVKLTDNGKTVKPTAGRRGISPAAVLSHLNWSSLFSSASKLFVSNSDNESRQATKQLAGMLVSLIDGLRLSFTINKGQARSDDEEYNSIYINDAALAGLSMLKAYVKTIISDDHYCIRKYLCQANREAVKDGNKIGFMIAQLGSYATTYMLKNIRHFPLDMNFEAAKYGRNGANCEARYNQCVELNGWQ